MASRHFGISAGGNLRRTEANGLRNGGPRRRRLRRTPISNAEMPIRFNQCEPMRDSRSVAGAPAENCGGETGGIATGGNGCAGNGSATTWGERGGRVSALSTGPGATSPAPTLRSKRSRRMERSRTSARKDCRSLSCEFTVSCARERTNHYK